MPGSEAWSVGYVVNILPHSAYRCIVVAAGLLLAFETETPVLVRSLDLLNAELSLERCGGEIPGGGGGLKLTLHRQRPE